MILWILAPVIRAAKQIQGQGEDGERAYQVKISPPEESMDNDMSMGMGMGMDNAMSMDNAISMDNAMSMDMDTGAQTSLNSSSDAGHVSSQAKSGMGMGMGMGMSFFISTDTPLFIKLWAPGNLAEYAASCLFLVTLAIFSRFLIAFKTRLEIFWQNSRSNRIHMTQADELSKNIERVHTESEFGKDVNTQDSSRGQFLTDHQSYTEFPPWRLTVDPVRATLDTTIAAVGFFL